MRVKNRGLRLVSTLVATGLLLVMGFHSDAAGQVSGSTDEVAPGEATPAAIAPPAGIPPAAIPGDVLPPTAIPAVIPRPAGGGLDLSTLPIPEGRFLPYISPCSFDAPQFRVSQAIGIVGEHIGWYALGFRSGST